MFPQPLFCRNSRSSLRLCLLLLLLCRALGPHTAAAQSADSPATPTLAAGQSASSPTLEIYSILVPSPNAADRPTTFVDLALEYGSPRVVTLEELLISALAHNYAIKITRLDEAQALDEIEARKGIYDTTLGIKAQQRHSTSRSQLDEKRVAEELGGSSSIPISSNFARFVQPINEKSDVREGAITLSQLAPTGAALELDTNASRQQLNAGIAGSNFNPLYQRGIAIAVTQPLLKNFGPYVTNSRINIAKYEHQLAQSAFRQQTQDQVAAIMEAYWDLVFAFGNTQVNSISLEQAQGQLKVSNIKFKTGVLPQVDVLQAEAGVAEREGNLISSKAAIRDAQDRIKKLVEGQSVEWTENIIPLDHQLTFREYPVTLDQFLLDALDMRPDYQQLKLAQEILEINKRVAKNQRLPELNLFASYGLTGLDDSLSAADDQLWTQDFDNWTYGIEFSYALQNRAARYSYRKALKDFDQGRLEIENLHNLIVQQIRFLSRRIETNRQLIDSARAQTRAEKAKLAAEQKRYDAGLSTSQDVLEFQEDLVQAATNYLQALVNYNKSIIALERDKGTLLNALNIKIETVAPELIAE